MKAMHELPIPLTNGLHPQKIIEQYFVSKGLDNIPQIYLKISSTSKTISNRIPKCIDPAPKSWKYYLKK